MSQRALRFLENRNLDEEVIEGEKVGVVTDYLFNGDTLDIDNLRKIRYFHSKLNGTVYFDSSFEIFLDSLISKKASFPPKKSKIKNPSLSKVFLTFIKY